MEHGQTNEDATCVQYHASTPSFRNGRPLGLRVLCLVEQQETTNVSEMAIVDDNMEVDTKRGCTLRNVPGENREKCNFHFFVSSIWNAAVQPEVSENSGHALC